MDRMVLLHDSDEPAITWNDGDPYIEVTNNHLIGLRPSTIAGAWFVTKALLGYVFLTWRNLWNVKAAK